VEQSEDIKELTAALVQARPKFKPLTPDKVNPHFHSKYASLNQCLEVTDPALIEAGLLVTQWLEPGPDALLACTTQVQHVSGQWQRSTCYLPVVQANPQAAGSAITYARRYGYCAALGLAPDDDDDGNSASVNSNNEPRYQAPAPAGNAPTSVPSRRSDNGDDMVVSWGKGDPSKNKAPSKWYGKKFSEVWAAGNEGHSYLHWVAEDSSLNPTTKAAARAFIDAAKASAPVIATVEEIDAFKKFYSEAGLDMEALTKVMFDVDAKYGGIPSAWLQQQNERVLAKVSGVDANAPAEDGQYTPEDDIPY
jgi:hypothetical protein